MEDIRFGLTWRGMDRFNCPSNNTHERIPLQFSTYVGELVRYSPFHDQTPTPGHEIADEDTKIDW